MFATARSVIAKWAAISLIFGSIFMHDAVFAEDRLPQDADAGFVARPTTSRLSRVEHFQMRHPNGRDSFQISVSRPTSLPANAKDVPVLFVLDGDTNFGIATEMARFRAYLNMPTAIVVGVGYGTDLPETMKRRSADLSLPLSADAKAELRLALRGMGEQFGGADAMLSFLINDLKPEILRRYPEASPTRQILFGHSLGGNFAALILLTRPEAFSTYILSSPALFWNHFAVLKYFSGFPERLKSLPAPPNVLITVASLEGYAPYKVAPELGMTKEDVVRLFTLGRVIPASLEFRDSLRANGVANVEHLVCEDEERLTSTPCALMRGFSFALKPVQ